MKDKNEMKEIIVKDIVDIFNACCSLDHKGYADTAISISYGIIEEKKEINIPLKTIFNKANLAFAKKDDYIQMDIIFNTHLDPKLNHLYKILDQYDKDDKTCEEKTQAPYLQFSLVPMILKGRYQIILTNPDFYMLCSEKISEYPHMVRMLFHVDDVMIMETDAIDYKKLLAHVERQIDMEEFYAIEENKKRERDAYEAQIGMNKAMR